MKGTIHINAIAYQEGDAWIAQGIEYDIVAHATNMDDLPDAFSLAVTENICISQHLGRMPLQGIKPAPDRFVAMYRRASRQLPVRRKDNAEIDLRVAA